MIAYIRGVLTVITEESVVVDVHGVGYEIICANPFDFQTNINEEVHIHTYHHVRDDAQILYGFKEEAEKQLFMKLISVSGIGPKSGLNIQGNVTVQDFVAAVEREDEKYLMSFRGIGKKTARQIILDLKGKLTGFISVTEMEQASQTPNEQELQTIRETEEALQALGYKPQEIQKIIPKLHQFKEKSTDELVRRALGWLASS